MIDDINWDGNFMFSFESDYIFKFNLAFFKLLLSWTQNVCLIIFFKLYCF
jgi:hypothetical protein